MSHIAVVGDCLLDRDLEGTARRLSPEGVVPVVEEPAMAARPGGAGLAAALAARGGAEVRLVTALGADLAGAELRALLERAGVVVHDLGLRGPTPEKVRVRAAGRSLVRLDRGCDPAGCGGLTTDAASAVSSASAVVVADYGRGLTGRPDVRAALAAAARRVPLVWDPHPRGAVPVDAAAVVTPNQAEAATLAGPSGVGVEPREAEPEQTQQADAVTAGARQGRTLLAAWRPGAVLVTLGARGAVLVQGDALPIAIAAPPASGDDCGAGDALAVAMALTLRDGAEMEAAATAAVRAASAFVARGGAAAWDATAGSAPASTDAVELAGAIRGAGGTVVATGGCFDLLHAGHLALLQGARALGDCLIVCLNSDESARELKGDGRPIVGQADRAAVLLSTRWVDSVLLFDEPTPDAALRRLRPHLWVKGGDYAAAGLPERATLREWGGEAVTVPYLDGRSTSRLVELARRSA